MVRNRVREVRLQRGQSLRELATRIAVHPSLLSRLERQQCGVADETKVRIAAVLCTSVADLFYPDYVENPSTRRHSEAVA